MTATEEAPIGHRRWAIAEGYIPPQSTGTTRQLRSHETACLLNANDSDAHVRIQLYFKDREPAGPYEVTVPARRTLHQRRADAEQRGGQHGQPRTALRGLARRDSVVHVARSIARAAAYWQYATVDNNARAACRESSLVCWTTMGTSAEMTLA